MTDLSVLKIDSGFWYLATPYSKYPAGTVQAAHTAAFLAARLMSKGVPVFSPIAHSHFCCSNGPLDPLDHDFWMKADRPFMEAAHGLIVAKMTSWTSSLGVMQEIDAFFEAEKPVKFLDPVTFAIDEAHVHEA